VAVWMAERGMVPDLVLVSSAVRAQETFGIWRVLRSLAGQMQMLGTSSLAELSLGDELWSETLTEGTCQWVGCWSPRDL
jgi:hypothetical protein